MIEAYIGLGSNREHPVDKITAACEQVSRLPATQLVVVSSLYRSAPMVAASEAGQSRSSYHHSGRPRYQAALRRRQQDYVNAVIKIETELSALQLLNRLQGIENRLGRLRTGYRWGPRPIDLDLLLYGKCVLRLPRLQVPHYGLVERAFVVIPLMEIAGEALRIPGKGRLSDVLAPALEQELEQLDSCIGKCSARSLSDLAV